MSSKNSSRFLKNAMPHFITTKLSGKFAVNAAFNSQQISCPGSGNALIRMKPFQLQESRVQLKPQPRHRYHTSRSRINDASSIQNLNGEAERES